jgi:two-component system, chemotaxis family, response regulator Rcp1
MLLTTAKGRPQDRPHVLLVGNNPHDLRATKEAFQDADASVILDVVPDGQQAVAFLRRQGAHVSAVRPALIVLDLSLPRMDGPEVLNFIKTDASLRTCPTILLSMSDEKSDIQKSYELRANSYFAKPAHYDRFLDLIKGVIDFWLTEAKWRG